MKHSPLPVEDRVARRTDWCVAAALILLFLGASAGIGVTTPHPVPDTPTYSEFDFRFPELLAQMRTPGYPLYLELHERLVGSFRWVSWGHAVIYAIAAVFFSQSVPGSRRIRFAVLVGLLGTNIYWLYANTIATDTLAAAMGLAVMGFTLRCAHRPTAGNAVGVCLFAVIAWLMRPAMVAVIPAGLLTCGFLMHGRSWRARVAGVCRIAALLCIPILLYCSLRLVTIGKFGIVSFGGYNLIGVVGQFPSAETAPLSSAEAQQVREKVNELKASLPADLAHLPPMNYTRIELNYDRTIWRWYVPAAKEVTGDDPAKINSILREIGMETLRSAPREYAIWLVKAFRQAVRQTLDDLAESPLGLLGIALLATAVCVRRAWPSSNVLSLVQLSLSYWVSLIGLTIVVCPPLGRMTDAAALFLAPAVLACAVDVIGRERLADQVSTAAASARPPIPEDLT